MNNTVSSKILKMGVEYSYSLPSNLVLVSDVQKNALKRNRTTEQPNIPNTKVEKKNITKNL